MTYLAFLVATGFYLLVGPGGPLHGDAWYHALRRRVDAISPEAWLGFTLLVVVPCAVLGLVFAVLTELFGAAAQPRGEQHPGGAAAAPDLQLQRL